MKLGFRFRMMLAILIVSFACVIAVSVTNYYDAKRMIEQNYVTSLDEKMTLQFENLSICGLWYSKKCRLVCHR